MEQQLYELNFGQDVANLQCKYTLFKRVINIISSVSSTEELDFNLLKEAYNKVIERNDCLRIRFVTKNKQLMQYFLKEYKQEEIPVLEFATKEEQEKFIKKISKHAIKYKKGVVSEPYFIKTYDGKYMVLLKVCHLILDMYGINILFKDLFGVYNALKNNTPLPPQPASFEEIVQKDVKRKHNDERNQKNHEFFYNFLKNREEPWYTGIHGPEEPIWKKQLAKNKKAMKMFFIHNDTEGYCYPISSDVTKMVNYYCEQEKHSSASLLFYACSICASRINGNRENMLPLQLYNCRGTANEKNCAGIKVQSLGTYTHIDFDKSFKENFNNFCNDQKLLSLHIGFPDMEYEKLLHQIYGASFLETYYSLTFSFIPYELPDGLEFNMYSNGKGALPGYIAQLYNVKTHEINMGYDVHSKTTSEQDVYAFHNKYIEVLKQVTANPNILVKDIQV